MSMVCCHNNGNVRLHVCEKFHDHTYTQCFMLIVKGYGNVHSHCLRLVAIGYEYSAGYRNNGNVGLHVCTKFHEHTYTVLYAHSKG